MTKKYGFLFPGQGSQSVGMGFSLASRFPEFEVIFSETLREADATLNFPISNIIKEGPAEKLKETDITQPALLIVSTAVGRWLKSKGVSAAAALGHSLGEYSALVHAEAISFKDALKLVHLRGKLMQTAVPSGQGGMAALIGATPEAAQKLCEALGKSAGKVLEPSAYNSPGQVVVSGHIEAIDEAVKRAKEFSVRMATKLEVSGPFHCSLLKRAGEELGIALNNTSISAPSIPVISNTTALPEKTADEIRDNLTRQVFQAVRWEESLRYISKQGINSFLEVGSGKVLTGLLKKNLPEAECTPIETIENLNALIQ